MTTIRVVTGTGTGPTELSAFDAALADANVHEYNLVRLSSVIPAGATVDVDGTAPDLGPVGSQLRVVEASAVARDGPASAALGWARRADDSGVFYEAAGAEPPDRPAERVTDGLGAAVAIREGEFGEPTLETATTSVDGDADHVSAVVLAVYGAGTEID